MLLAIDTATQILSLALHDGNDLLAECTLLAGRRHSALLAPLIQQLLAQVEVEAADLTALAVSVGPGSYTGTRIGVALAKGLAAGQRLPLLPVTTLETIAAQGYPRPGPLIATVSAGRQRVIWAEYHYAAAAWRERQAPQISDWAALLAAYGQPIFICGEVSPAGWQAVQAAQAKGGQIEVAAPAVGLRRAGYLAEIAWRRWRENAERDSFPAERVMPLYLKPPG